MQLALYNSGYGTILAQYSVQTSSMIALEFKEQIEVTTSKGDGYVWYMMDYGPQSDTLYTIIIKETGECWQMCHKDFRVKQNVTMGIGGKYERLQTDTPALNNYLHKSK